MENRPENDTTTMTKEINELQERLNFSEEAVQVISTNGDKHIQGFESWAMGKIMASEAPNREAMYRVFRSLWYKEEEIDFVDLKERIVIVKFGCLEDQSRILNFSPWLFNRCLFSMLPFENKKDIESYKFWLSLFWLKIYNIPIELMDRQMALDVGNAIGELVAIDWTDRYGGWTEFMRIKVNIDVLKPLMRVVRVFNKDGAEKIGVINMNDGEKFRFTRFYGQTDPSLRQQSGDMLRRVKSTVNEGWIVGGDFNAILNPDG
ncbi:hypothetical protein PVK06_005841 [Gossypium arboreum]|uniref:DUF4283 domain-containing protein n=1 Tax=Gossypium arboreum TaxID=29729 RepID=A0ABR0QVM9_GOSAR|nr:hypothetical protein PVK06_005841 [Gossypium arboreum]